MRRSDIRSAVKSFFCNRILITNALRLVLVLVVLWGEAGAFFWSVSSCAWPVPNPTSTSKLVDNPAHVLILSDPQVQHAELIQKGSNWSGYFSRVIFDAYLRKGWRAVARLKPHEVIFLGDMLANGKAARSLAEYEQAALKFKTIFSPSPPVHHIPGNNDVGMGLYTPPSENIRDFYAAQFGAFNQRFSIRNHTFLGLDSPGLVDEDYQRSAHGASYAHWGPVSGGPVEAVREVAVDRPSSVILLSHIPLFRSHSTVCGPLRERGSIRLGVGHGYQTTLGKQTTTFLLESLRPDAIFSGDNRDYCEIIHSTVPVREVTVKSFSLSVHIRRPGFQLLSLVDPSTASSLSSPSLLDAPCNLPDQFAIYSALYFPSFLLAILVMLAHHIVTRGRPRLSPLTFVPPHVGSEAWSPTTASPRTPSFIAGDRTPAFLRTPSVSALRTSPNILRTASPILRASSPGFLRTSSPGVFRASTPRSRPATPSSSVFSLPLDSDMDGAYIGKDRGADADGKNDSEGERNTYAAQYHYDDEEWGVVDEREGMGVGIGSDHEHEYEHVYGSGAGEGYFDARPSPAEKTKSLSGEFATEKLSGKPGYVQHVPPWTWTFVLFGRRRRVTLSAQSVVDALELLWGSGSESAGRMTNGRRRGVLRDTAADVVRVVCPAVVVWVLMMAYV